MLIKISSPIMIMFFLSFGAIAGPDIDSLQKIRHGFNESMVRCPEKVWPGFSWSNFQVILVGTNSAHLWKGTTGLLEEYDFQALPESAVGRPFELFSLNGITTMSLQTEGSVEKVFKTGVHEFFHFTEQESWQSSTGQRGTLYPQGYLPRIYRRMLYDRLKEYLESYGEDKVALKKASYWYKKWKSEYAEEAMNTADGYEGTAKYVETIADVIRVKSCDISAQELKQESVANFLRNSGGSVGGRYFDLSFEGYDVGGISSLILRFVNGDSDWHEVVESGKTPLEFLLDDIQVEVDSVPSELEQVFRAQAETTNAVIGQLVDQDLNSYKSDEVLHISIPSPWLRSNFGPRYFLISQSFPGMTILPMIEKLSFRNGPSYIDSAPDKVFFFDPNNPCEPGFSFVVDQSDLSEGEKHLTIKGSGVNGYLESYNKVNNWICGQ